MAAAACSALGQRRKKVGRRTGSNHRVRRAKNSPGLNPAMIYSSETSWVGGGRVNGVSSAHPRLTRRRGAPTALRQRRTQGGHASGGLAARESVSGLAPESCSHIFTAPLNDGICIQGRICCCLIYCQSGSFREASAPLSLTETSRAEVGLGPRRLR